MANFVFVNTAEKITIKDITYVEEKIKQKLPLEIVNHYLLFNGGELENDRCVYVDSENDIEADVKTFLPIKHKRFQGDSLLEDSYILFVFKKKIMPPNFIPFAMDNGGFRYCYNIDDFKIYLCDLDRIEKPSGPMKLIAPSLNAFINGMKTEEEAYE